MSLDDFEENRQVSCVYKTLILVRGYLGLVKTIRVPLRWTMGYAVEVSQPVDIKLVFPLNILAGRVLVSFLKADQHFFLFAVVVAASNSAWFLGKPVVGENYGGDGLCHSGVQALLCVAWVYVGIEKLMQRGIMVLNITYLVLGALLLGWAVYRLLKDRRRQYSGMILLVSIFFLDRFDQRAF
ncbi:hypothetical protein [Corynebacterium silvaticum]|uniref:Uncharacterized protein n=1 Tax=Corynebacterium silvaticum TaxID=2320431 RepID=A0ACD4PYH6_9CORY|nr:hypothetical protein [Corynebacterium silvaticum]WCV10622.1 hypothetical protein CBE74_13005 [Corynebacterium silvaticum]